MEKTDSTLATRDHHQVSAVAAPAGGMLTVEDVLQQLKRVQEVMNNAMKLDIHYGRIPGCGEKPTLLKPGAELLCNLFQLAATFEIDERDLGNGHREYRTKCTLTGRFNRALFGEGLGTCSTMEAKYRYRAGASEITDKPVPRAFWDLRQEDPAKAQELIGGKGFSTKKVDGVWMIAKSGERAENDNPADCYNTVLKMAQKRALVAVVLVSTAASDIFTQDLEDISANLEAIQQRDISRQPALVPAAPAAVQTTPRPATTPQPEPRRRPQPTQRQEAEPIEAEIVPDLRTKEEWEARAAQELQTRVHFGKNRGVLLADLTPQARHWYEQDWMVKKEVNGPSSVEDLALINSLKGYRMARNAIKALEKAQPKVPTVHVEDDADLPPWDVEEQTQERPTTLQQVRAKIAEEHVSEEELVAACRKKIKGDKPMLGADEGLDKLSDEALLTILTGWRGYFATIKTNRSVQTARKVQPMSQMPAAAAA